MKRSLLAFLIVLVISKNAFALVTITKTIKPSGGDYTSLSAAEAGEQRDLVAADEIAVLECYSMQDTTAVVIAGWTTDATRYIKVYTLSSERHDGKWDTSAYRLTLSNDDNEIFIISEDYVRVEGFQSYNSSTTNPGNIYYSGGGELQVSYSILRGSVNSGSRHLLHLDPATNSAVKIWNNIFYDGNNAGIFFNFDNAGQIFIIYNNTIVDCTGEGILIKHNVGDVSLYLKNNICQGNTTDYDITTFTTRSYLTNISEDTTSPNASYRSKVVTFENEGSDDFHLGAGDTEAKDNGTDLSGDGQLAFSDDIDGDTRSGSWDIGADELVAAPGVTIPLFYHHYKQMGN